MGDTTQPVDQNATVAGAAAGTSPTSGVETKPALAPEVDPVQRVEELLEKNRKLAEERDNYRTAALIAKEKQEDEEEPELATLVQAEVKKALASTDSAKAMQELEELAKEQARQLKELKLVAAQKTTFAPASSGGGEPVATPQKDAYFSDEQLRHLRETKGFSDKQIEALKVNLTKF